MNKGSRPGGESSHPARQQGYSAPSNWHHRAPHVERSSIFQEKREIPVSYELYSTSVGWKRETHTHIFGS